MSVPDTAPPRKPRRFWLYFPFVLALLGAVALGGAWAAVRARTLAELDSAAVALRARGYEVAWSEAKIDGFPFRLNLTLADALIRDPSGWGVSTPRLEAESMLHRLGHWVMAAPQGLTFDRPQGGRVQVGGEVIRASLSGFDKTPPNLSFEGTRLTFSPVSGAQPFALSTAEKVEFHLRPGPDDQGAALLKVEGGQGRPGGLFALAAPAKPVTLTLEAILSKASAFNGQDWTASARAWSAAGGAITLRRLSINAGDTTLSAAGAALKTGRDGGLRGNLDVELRGAPVALTALAQSGAIPADAAQAAQMVVAARQTAPGQARLGLVFEAGRTTLGPVALGPAPRLF